MIDRPGWYVDDGVTDSIHEAGAGRGAAGAWEVGRNRHKLRLSQWEAGRVIGGGPNAFQKYKAGGVVVGHAISRALRLLDAHPEALAVLLAHRGGLSAA